MGYGAFCHFWSSVACFEMLFCSPRLQRLVICTTVANLLVNKEFPPAGINLLLESGIISHFLCISLPANALTFDPWIRQCLDRFMNGVHVCFGKSLIKASLHLHLHASGYDTKVLFFVYFLGSAVMSFISSPVYSLSLHTILNSRVVSNQRLGRVEEG